MDKKDIFRVAEDSRFISGIYNYCDRWCERCSFTSRCMTYAMETADIDNPASRDINNRAFWYKLQEIFKQTEEMIKEIAEQMGVDLNSIDTKTISEKMDIQEATADSHELVVGAHCYGKMADIWLDSGYAIFGKKKEELNDLLAIGIEEVKIHNEAADIQDAVEVIRWYQHQIYVKLKRALIKDDLFDENAEVMLSDANGSVKVALIGMDRSIGAWGKLLDYFPEKTDDVLDILLHLDRLRRKTEDMFPQARSFKRPGFDHMHC